MNNDKFLIVKNVKSFIIGLEKILATILKKDYLSRELIYKESLLLLDNVVKANYETDKDRKKTYQIEALLKVNLLDFCMVLNFKIFGDHILKFNTWLPLVMIQ